jgi:hypothetical protein
MFQLTVPTERLLTMLSGISAAPSLAKAARLSQVQCFHLSGRNPSPAAEARDVEPLLVQVSSHTCNEDLLSKDRTGQTSAMVGVGDLIGYDEVDE